MRRTRVVLAVPLAAAAILAACAPRSETTPDTPSPGGTASGQPSRACTPLETRDPNARDQRPAFAGQTRTCGVRSNVAFDVAVVARGIKKPWSVEPLPDGAFLVTEKPGRMRIVYAAGQVGQPIAGVLPVDSAGQGGLLDAALSPRFATDRTVFWSFSEPREGGNGTSVARGVLSADRTRLEQVRVILRTRPTYANNMHFGSRLAFGPDGMLYVTMGERSARETRPQAQELGSHLGKTLRINPDGSVPRDNPFVNRAGARPEIWSYGHRNAQAAALQPSTRELWTVEHGARGGDEINNPQAGRNYGWPVITYGVDYSGAKIGEGTAKAGMEQPVYYWDPVIAPSGAVFYTGQAFAGWQGDLFVGSMNPGGVVRLDFENGRVRQETRYLGELDERIRDVQQGSDGLLYVLTDSARGRVLKLAPKKN